MCQVLITKPPLRYISSQLFFFLTCTPRHHPCWPTPYPFHWPSPLATSPSVTMLWSPRFPLFLPLPHTTTPPHPTPPQPSCFPYPCLLPPLLGFVKRRRSPSFSWVLPLQPFLSPISTSLSLLCPCLPCLVRPFPFYLWSPPVAAPLTNSSHVLPSRPIQST